MLSPDSFPVRHSKAQYGTQRPGASACLRKNTQYLQVFENQENSLHFSERCISLFPSSHRFFQLAPRGALSLFFISLQVELPWRFGCPPSPHHVARPVAQPLGGPYLRWRWTQTLSLTLNVTTLLHPVTTSHLPPRLFSSSFSVSDAPDCHPSHSLQSPEISPWRKGSGEIRGINKECSQFSPCADAQEGEESECFLLRNVKSSK